MFSYIRLRKGLQSPAEVSRTEGAKLSGMTWSTTISNSFQKKIFIVNFSVILEGKRIFERHNSRWDNILTVDLKEAGC